MSLTLYLDDCICDRKLVDALRAAGHRVIIPVEVGLRGEDDDVHFNKSRELGAQVVTRNARDFAALIAADSAHPGILAVYLDNDPKRDMTIAEIVRAIANLEGSGPTLAGTLHSLNDWRY